MASDHQQDPIVILSNRGPVQYGRSADGERITKRGGGGLVTALSGLAGDLPESVWVCATQNEHDAEVAAEHGEDSFAVDGGPLRVRLVDVDKEAYEKYYGVISNPMLWFIQHYLWDLARAPNITRHEKDAFHNGYVKVNQQFADAVADEVEKAGGCALVLIQDYHFYLVGERLRNRLPNAFLLHFVHIPWPQPDAWRVLPPELREPILKGLLGNDVVGFHTYLNARNFLLGCQELLGSTVDFNAMTVEHEGHVVRARSYPISVDAESFDTMAETEAVRSHQAALEAVRREHLILRVDRTDLSKNIVRGFLAYDTLLKDHPELREKVTFLALLPPSRQDVRAYRRYFDEIRRVAADVNLEHGTPVWQPIDLRMEENMAQAVAAYKLFDVLMVNAIYDGMNLVAKEALLVNERNGVLALSENTGAYEELGDYAVTVHPFDIEQQAEALYEALTMSAERRKDLHDKCEAIVREHDVSAWLKAQLNDARDGRSDA